MDDLDPYRTEREKEWKNWADNEGLIDRVRFLR